MNIALASIQRDTSIQTRAEINMETVNSYAEAMTDGAEFPPVVLFGTEGKCWIGDGWHRVMASEQIGAMDIPAEVRAGGRVDALKHALGANAIHGQRRTNADKRRCVELAVKEFASLSSRAIAELCGVSVDTVCRHREPLSDSDNATRTTSDGRQYPAKRNSRLPTTPEEEEAMYLGKEENERKQKAKPTGKQKENSRPIPAALQGAINYVRNEMEVCAANDWLRCDRNELVKQLTGLLNTAKG